MGRHGPFARETSDPEPSARPIIDPVALEDRLKIARELRAEALARRDGAGRGPSPRANSRLAPPRPPAPLIVSDPAAPPLQTARPTATPSAARAAGLPAPHPVVALLALCLSVSAVFSRGADAPPPRHGAEAVTVEAPAAPPDLSDPALPRPAARLAPPTEISPAPGAAPPASVAARLEPAPAAQPDPKPTPKPTQAQARAPATALGFAPPGLPAASVEQASLEPAPRSERVLVNAPQGVAPEAIDAALAALRGTGYADVANQPTRLTISTNSVRYYNAEDAAAAAEIAALVAPFLPGGTAEARDFTDAPSRAASGRLEIWVAGAAPAASRSAPARPPAPVIDAAAIQRLVERVRAEPALENAGRGAADAARGFEAGAERFARQVDAAVGGALRALEGQP